MQIKKGMTFRNSRGTKCHIVNVFTDENECIITYKYWMKRKKVWKLEADFKYLFLIAFDFGWKWE